jgi:hypothetical protein
MPVLLNYLHLHNTTPPTIRSAQVDDILGVLFGQQGTLYALKDDRATRLGESVALFVR